MEPTPHRMPRRRAISICAPSPSTIWPSRRWCSIPHADEIVDANPAACRLLGYDRALLRETRFSALHAGQVPALIVFTQAVLAKGALLDQRADAAPCHQPEAAARIYGIAAAA